jgi:hypothetical protein
MLPCHRLARVAGILLLVAAPAALADSVTITTSRDNTLFEDEFGTLSNGAGQFLYAGKAERLRRGLLYFDVAAVVPAGSAIQSVTVTLYCSKAPLGGPPNSPAVEVSLHEALASWGEGTSNAGDPGGLGAPATAGDATWVHTVYPGSLWTTPGGDYDAAASATQTIAGVGYYSWSAAGLVADVQGWLDNPAVNHGWFVVGHEHDAQRARRFDTRENFQTSQRPALEIVYETGQVAVTPAAWSAIKELFR